MIFLYFKLGFLCLPSLSQKANINVNCKIFIQSFSILKWKVA